MAPRGIKILVDIQSIETGKKAPKKRGVTVLPAPGRKSVKSRKGKPPSR
jgi:hypothetical protein